MKLKPGQVLDSKYMLLSLLGEGGMGMVFAAQHVESREKRAIKIMRPGLLGDREQAERFRREAQSAASLRSAHVCKVVDVGKLPDGSPFIVMEHLEGRDLKAALKEHHTLPIADAVRYTMEACDALAEAHRNGIVHRDLKPGNLYLARGPDGQSSIKILDFGVAKVNSHGGALGTMPEITQNAQMLGTPAYMAPEQMRAAKDVDGRADIWSLGVILYRMLTSDMPFPGEDALDIITGVLSEAPVPPAQLRRDIPSGLDAAVLRCLEKDPTKRFQSAEELSATIAPFAAIRPVQAASPLSDGSDEVATIAFARPFMFAPRPAAAQQAPASAPHPMMVSGGTIPIPRDLVASLITSPHAPRPAPPPPPAPMMENPLQATVLMAPMPKNSVSPYASVPAAPPPPAPPPPAPPPPAAIAPLAPVVADSVSRPSPSKPSGGRRFLIGLLVSLAVSGALIAGFWLFRHAR